MRRDQVKKFTAGVYTGVAYLFLSTLFFLESLALQFGTSTDRPRHVYFVLCNSLAGLALVSSIACWCYPRRPDVFYHGKLVDRQFTASILSRHTFSWCTSVFQTAAAKDRLELDDLPRLDSKTRSAQLERSFRRMQPQEKLWKLILYAHASAFSLQWGLTVPASFLDFGPQYSMLKILQVLEGSADAPPRSLAWIWVVALGLSKVFSILLECWIVWLSDSCLALRIRAQLSALIFAKAVRRKNVEGWQDQDASDAAEANSQDNDSTLSTPIGATDSLRSSDTQQKVQKSQLNLISIDAGKVSDAACNSNTYPSALFKLAISFFFLSHLLGWKSLLVGFAVIIVFTPLNIYLSTFYAINEDRLMEARDSKMTIITEALRGIRQIKYSALEPEWEEKIEQSRTAELKRQRAKFLLDTGLVWCWTAGPILLAAASLSAHAYIHQGLTASVAFTALAIFAEIEVALSSIPETFTQLLDAKVSSLRIEKYLKSPEKATESVSADSITFKDALISWPSESTEFSNKFQLGELNFSIPNQKLTIISGQTGSGKSLLLASVIGEADTLSGYVLVPKRSETDLNISATNWLSPSSMAFVSQTPWIENASIRDNILFGLPLDSSRYQEVLRACALQTDLEMLVDYDLTEIGANGINLSGGQRWRVCLARALYSRAGILVLDDIFSAVDAHVGKHILDHALLGSLSKGRTRIVATHHAELCIPMADYNVHLHDGSVSCTSLASTSHSSEHESAPSCGSEHSQSDFLPLRDTRPAMGTVRAGETEPHKTKLPRIFVAEEERETGSVKWKFYKDYLQSSGSIWFWSFITLLFGGNQIALLARSWIVKLWASSSEVHSQAKLLLVVQNLRKWSKTPSSSSDKGLWFYLGLYIGISLVTSLSITLCYFWSFSASLKASRVNFEKFTLAVLHAPLRWYDTVPLGRILNRFSADFEALDSEMAFECAFFMFAATFGVSIVIAGYGCKPSCEILELITILAALSLP